MKMIMDVEKGLRPQFLQAQARFACRTGALALKRALGHRGSDRWYHSQYQAYLDAWVVDSAQTLNDAESAEVNLFSQL
jgi:hypothetical protein